MFYNIGPWSERTDEWWMLISNSPDLGTGSSDPKTGLKEPETGLTDPKTGSTDPDNFGQLRLKS
jgi:hypothetical protein